MKNKSLFKIKDLYIAYKKVKFELFNDKNTITTLKLYEYEKNLNNNMETLCYTIFLLVKVVWIPLCLILSMTLPYEQI